MSGCASRTGLSFQFLVHEQSGSSHPLSWLKCAYSGVVHMLIASFMTSYMVLLACCRISLVDRWSFVCVCSAIADLLAGLFANVSLCSLFLAWAWFCLCTPCRMCMALRRRRWFFLAERGSFTLVRRLWVRTWVTESWYAFLILLLTPAKYRHWRLLCFVVIFVAMLSWWAYEGSRVAIPNEEMALFSFSCVM